MNGNTNRTARMVLNICFVFMMLMAFLVEFGTAKRQMWQKHNAQSANFYLASLRVTATATRQQADVQVTCLNRQQLSEKLTSFDMRMEHNSKRHLTNR
jgi:hypothetical protein